METEKGISVNKLQLIITAFENLDANMLELLLEEDRVYDGYPKEIFVHRFREYFDEVKKHPYGAPPKPLIKVNNPTQDGSGLTDKLELWDLEPYEVTNQTPRWTWKISEIENPVLQPCNPNWKLRLTKNGKIIRDDKVKYFDRKSLIELGPFLLIHLL